MPTLQARSQLLIVRALELTIPDNVWSTPYTVPLSRTSNCSISKAPSACKGVITSSLVPGTKSLISTRSCLYRGRFGAAKTSYAPKCFVDPPRDDQDLDIFRHRHRSNESKNTISAGARVLTHKGKGIIYLLWPARR